LDLATAARKSAGSPIGFKTNVHQCLDKSDCIAYVIKGGCPGQKDLNIRYWALGVYLVVLVGGYIAPFNCSDISKVTVLQFRLDYLVHVLMFAPLVLLWRLVFPRHPWWVVLGTGLGLATGLEGLQYVLSYRSWNVNDMIGNVIGVLLGSGIALLKKLMPVPRALKEKK
jgi:hypothetical protein